MSHAIPARLFPVILLLLAVAAYAYDNDGRDANGVGLLKGGPHRTINDMALDYYILNMAPERMEMGNFTGNSLLTGPTVTAPGMEVIFTGDRTNPFRWWVIEGGYDADEPELYNSFRHFYDPKAVSGVPYLTDDLDTLDLVYRLFIFTSVKGLIVGATAGTRANPKVNARDWALTGECNNGWGNNQYCLARGKEYMEQAFAETDRPKRGRLFAQAWRSIGETMHLLADMTCVPHVRNDSHPGKAVGFGPIGNTDPNTGMLRHDPYELMCNEQMVRDSRGTVDPAIKELIDKADDPADLFHQVALYTNENFFSGDTVSGTFRKTDPVNGEQEYEVIQNNRQNPYPLPELSKCKLLGMTGLFVRTINNRTVRVCHESWMSMRGWSEASMIVTRDCVRDQAAILIPLALYANAKLLKLCIPDIDVHVESFDTGTKNCTVKFIHTPSKVYDRPLEYQPSFDDRLVVWINGQKQPELAAKAIAVANDPTFNLGKFQLKPGDKIKVGLDIGGILFTSKEDYIIAQPAVGQTIFVPTITWELQDGARKKLAADTGNAFQKSVTSSIKYNKGQGLQTTEVTTTITASVSAPETPSGNPFNVKITLVRAVTCNPPEPDLDGTSNIGLVIPNTTGGSVSSLADPANPDTILLSMDFKPAGGQIYHIDQTAIPGFKGYVSGTVLPQGSVGGYAGNWNIATFGGNTGVTLNGNIRVSCYVNPNPKNFDLGNQWNNIAYILNCCITYRAKQ